MKRTMMVLAVVLALALPVSVWAQSEGLTLEGLAQQVASVVERVEAIERLLLPSPVTDIDGNCMLAAGDALRSSENWDGALHPSTLLAYTSLSNGKFPEEVTIKSVKVTPDGQIAVELVTEQSPSRDSSFREYGAFVVEYWNGCEFQSHSRFWEEPYGGGIVYLD